MPPNKKKQKFPDGTIVEKEFDAGVFRGEVKFYKAPYYRVVYSDGDQEDMTERQVKYHRVLVRAARVKNEMKIEAAQSTPSKAPEPKDIGKDEMKVEGLTTTPPPTLPSASSSNTVIPTCADQKKRKRETCSTYSTRHSVKLEMEIEKCPQQSTAHVSVSQLEVKESSSSTTIDYDACWLKEEHLLGRAFAHVPPGRTELRLGSVVQVRKHSSKKSMILDVMYTDSDDTIENVEYRKRASKNDPIETPFDVATFAEIVGESTKAQLDNLCNPHTEIIDVDGRYYAVDRDVFDATKPLFCLVVGKVPAPGCVRGRFWNCSQGRIWKSAVMGKAKLGGSSDREKMDKCKVEKAILPWHEETYLGRGVFQNEWLTDHGWACTDLSQKPRPFKSNPTQSEIEKGWGRINDAILKHQKPKVLFFVYKAVLDWLLNKVYKLTGVKSKYGLNDHWNESIRNEYFAGAHVFVFPMPGTGWAKNRQSKKPFCDPDVEMSKLHEIRKQWDESLNSSK